MVIKNRLTSFLPAPISGIIIFHCHMYSVLNTIISYFCPPFLVFLSGWRVNPVPGLPFRKLYDRDLLDNFFPFLFLFSSPFIFELVGFLTTTNYQL